MPLGMIYLPTLRAALICSPHWHMNISYDVGSACCSFTFPGNAKAFSGRTSNQYSSYVFLFYSVVMLGSCRPINPITGTS